ncbi:MAG: methyltransferase domain-containing protein [Myxococcales bacterium]|nr:methyltransferase domain-containing protein [Myxococcales bacterium]
MNSQSQAPFFCQACGEPEPEIFFEVDDVPVHSTLLMDSREEAQRYPQGSLKLGFCRTCGFVQNVVFDASVHEYSTKCEESQGFSPRFNAFLRALTLRLIETYDVRNKKVVEIGCGKGDFLELICALGHNSGIGIDPGIIPERQQHSEAWERIRFIQDFYSEAYGELTGEFMACRHTLEHIQPVKAFVNIVRRAIDKHPDTIVFFEIPDVERVLSEVAFWDIYYEHCSYFSLGSLGRLFRACGFKVLNLQKDFEDQYLVIEARPIATPEAAPQLFPGEDDLKQLAATVDRFKTIARDTLARWKRQIGGYAKEGKRVVIWGSSSKGVSFLTTLGLGDEIGYVVDINPFRQGKFMPGTGHEIVPPAKMAEYKPDVVLVMNPIYCEEIAASLSDMGLSPQIVPA